AERGRALRHLRRLGRRGRPGRRGPARDALARVMRPRAYPLEAARTVRGIARDRAADAWAEALRELAAATARRERAAERLRALRARPLPDAKEEGTAADLQRVVLYRERRREEEEALREELSRASAEERRAAA